MQSLISPPFHKNTKNLQDVRTLLNHTPTTHHNLYSSLHGNGENVEVENVDEDDFDATFA